MMAQNKAITRRLIDEVWNSRKTSVIDEVFASDFVMHDPAAPPLPVGPEGAKQYFTVFVTAFPDVRATADDIIAEGDKVSVRWSIHGTHEGPLMGIPPTGKPVTVTGQAIYRFAGGKIAEEWVHADVFGLMQQLGVISR